MYYSKKSFIPKLADEVKRQEYLELLSVYEKYLYPIVYIDKSGFKVESVRQYSYIPKGQTYQWLTSKY